MLEGFTKFSLPQFSLETLLLDVLYAVCACLCVSSEGNIVVQVCLTSGVEQAFTAHTNLPLWSWIRLDLFIQTTEVLELFHSDLITSCAKQLKFLHCILLQTVYRKLTFRGQFAYHLHMHQWILSFRSYFFLFIFPTNCLILYCFVAILHLSLLETVDRGLYSYSSTNI